LLTSSRLSTQVPTSCQGTLLPGQKADINLIDFDQLQAELPYMASDLPLGGKRLLQNARGYRRTLVNGITTYLNGEPTGALPGRLVRHRPASGV